MACLTLAAGCGSKVTTSAGHGGAAATSTAGGSTVTSSDAGPSGGSGHGGNGTGPGGAGHGGTGATGSGAGGHAAAGGHGGIGPGTGGAGGQAAAGGHGGIGPSTGGAGGAVCPVIPDGGLPSPDAGLPINGPEGPSCAGGLDCAGRSCCESLLVPGGSFPMGRGKCADRYDPADPLYPDETPEHEAIVASYYLDTFEVTVGRFRRFVEAYDGTPPAQGAGAHPLIPGSGWAGVPGDLPASQAALRQALTPDPQFKDTANWTDAPGGRESYPMNGLSWELAFAFCIWDGGRLPTEAEWEYAAAGGAENRLFPWGAAPATKDLAVFQCSEPVDPCQTAPVGSVPAGRGRWGHLDLSGNVSEFVRDGWALYPLNGGICDNCADLAWPGDVVRGGNFYTPTVLFLRAASRTNSYGGSLSGMRCARGP
jgi:formylglycine-generating enzyme required for sulfatase activity